MPPTSEPLARIMSPPPTATTFGSWRMPLCALPACVAAASSVVSVRKLTAVAALPIAVCVVCAPGEVVAQHGQRLPSAVDDCHGDRVAVLLASRQRSLRRLLRGGRRQRRVVRQHLLRIGRRGPTRDRSPSRRPESSA